MFLGPNTDIKLKILRVEFCLFVVSFGASLSLVIILLIPLFYCVCTDWLLCSWCHIVASVSLCPHALSEFFHDLLIILSCSLLKIALSKLVISECPSDYCMLPVLFFLEIPFLSSSSHWIRLLPSLCYICFKSLYIPIKLLYQLMNSWTKLIS